MSQLLAERYGEDAGKAVPELTFLSFSKENFYLRTKVTGFAIRQKRVPISLFMNVDYNLGGIVDKKLIRVAENTLLARCKELWVFGGISDGMLVEIFLAKKKGLPIRYFSLPDEGHDIAEISENEVTLANVSKWVWEWVLSGKNLERWHPRLRIRKTYPLVYPAYSKKNFYLQTYISKYCLENLTIPINPFMIFRYFLSDTVPREDIYLGNRAIIDNIDELWTFGPLSDGVLAEVSLAKKRGHKVKHYKIVQDKPSVRFRKVPAQFVELEEPELEKYRGILLDEIHNK